MMDLPEIILVAIGAFVIGCIFGNFVSFESTIANCQIQHEFRKGETVYDCVERVK